MATEVDVQAAEVRQDAVRRDVTGWLHDNLPAAWVAAVEGGDEATLASLAARVGIQAWLAELETGRPPEQPAPFELASWFERLGSAGYTTPTWPKEYSGLGMSTAHARVVRQVLDRFRVPRPFGFVGIELAGPTILAWGTDEQKEQHVAATARGQEVWCQLFSEPGAGSDLAGLSTRAERDGSTWVVNGQKVWTSLAHVADFGLLMTRTAPDQPKHRGITYFIADMRAEGVEVRPLRQISGEARFSEVFLSDVIISDSMRLGPVNEGWRVATTTLMSERSGLSGAPSVGRGLVHGLVEAAAASGTWSDAVTRDRLAALLTREQALQMTNARSAARSAAGPPGPEGSVTKLLQSLLTQHVTEAAIDADGPGGVAWPADADDMPMKLRAFLHERSSTIAGGTSEIQRNIIGERVLGLPREPDVDRDVPWRDVRRSG
jgi:alkylation response protein AidB-like acyl-CoA dehydrogenase